MKQFTRKIFQCQRGIGILELLIAMLITGLMTTAAFQFLVTMQNQSEAQQNLSEAQLLCRNSLMDIKKDLRMAGYKLTGHPAYEVKGDTLAIYLSQSQPVDTILYFLQEFSERNYAAMPDLPEGRQVYRLMRQTNSGLPNEFADYILNIQYDLVSPSNVVVRVTTQSPRPDEDYPSFNGYRSYSLAERVKIRNA
jgi:hypothetical protein